MPLVSLGVLWPYREGVRFLYRSIEAGGGIREVMGLIVLFGSVDVRVANNDWIEMICTSTSCSEAFAKVSLLSSQTKDHCLIPSNSTDAVPCQLLINRLNLQDYDKMSDAGGIPIPECCIQHAPPLQAHFLETRIFLGSHQCLQHTSLKLSDLLVPLLNLLLKI